MNGEGRHWKPWEIRRLTFWELERVCYGAPGPDRAPFGAVAVGQAEVQAYAQWRRTATPRERLEFARERRGQSVRVGKGNV
jgi:hypothetical protein